MTAGAIVVGGLAQRRLRIVPATYIGKGKLADLQEQVLRHRCRRGHLR